MNGPGERHTVRAEWAPFLACVLAVKAGLLLADPKPMFFLGDSASYIATALSGWIPPDRSFVYGYVVRWLAVPTGSLTVLVAVQALASGLTAVLAAWLLRTGFGAPPLLSFSCGALCAVEPLQLLYERYVLTETLSLLLFMIYMAIVFRYQRRPRVSTLAVLQAVGVLLIGFRLSYLPLVWVTTVLAPLSAAPAPDAAAPSPGEAPRSGRRRLPLAWATSPRRVLLHLAVSAALAFVLHFGYRSLNGLLIEAPPAYQYEGGFFMLADLAPVVRPIDFPFPELARAVYTRLEYDPADRRTRGSQRWEPRGIVGSLRAVVPYPVQANDLAAETSLNAIKRNPLGIATLMALTFGDYWDREYLLDGIRTDRGDNRPLPDDLLQALRHVFGLSADRFPYTETLTKRYYLLAWPWYLFLLCLPAAAGAALICVRGDSRRHALFLFVATAAAVGISCLLVERPTVRYLHPLGPLAFIAWGALAARILAKRRGAAEAAAPKGPRSWN